MTPVAALVSATRLLARPVELVSSVRAGLLGFGFVLLGWEILLLAALTFGELELGTYAEIHYAGCLVVTCCLLFGRNAAFVDVRRSSALQMIGWSALAGPFGAFVAIALSICPAPVPPDESTSAGDDDREPAIDRSEDELVEHMERALLDRRIRLAGARRTRPLIDVMAEGARLEKVEALGVVYRKYGAGMGAVLKHALRDPDASIRVLAATVTAKLNATYGRRIGECQALAAAAPKVPQNWRNLADARFAYAESGLLERTRACAEFGRGVDDLARASEIDPGDAETSSRLDGARSQLTTWRT